MQLQTQGLDRRRFRVEIERIDIVPKFVVLVEVRETHLSGKDKMDSLSG